MTFAVVRIHGHLSKPLSFSSSPNSPTSCIPFAALQFVSARATASACGGHVKTHVGQEWFKGGSSASAAALSGSTAARGPSLDATHGGVDRGEAGGAPMAQAAALLAGRCRGAAELHGDQPGTEVSRRGRVSVRSLCHPPALQATSCAVALGLRYSGVATALFDG